MTAVSSILWVWKTDSAGRWYFLTIPDEQSAEIRAAAFESPRGFGSVKVEARIGGVAWRTSVFPQKSGGYLLPVKAEVRKRAEIAAGDLVDFEMELLG